MKKRRWLPQLLLLVTIAGFGIVNANGQVWAQEAGSVGGGPERQQALHLKQGIIDTAERLDLAAEAVQLAGQTGRFVLQLEGPLDPLRQARLEASGVELGDYLPVHAYVVKLDRADPETVEDLSTARQTATSHAAPARVGRAGAAPGGGGSV